MSELKLLIVEDNKEELNLYQDTIRRYQKQKKRKVSVEEAFSVDEAMNKLDNSFDGAIIDLKLDTIGDEGCEVIKKIQTDYRIPIAVYTGTPANVKDLEGFLGVFKKGKTGLDEILDNFFEVFNTGITQILGSRGIIEKTMNEVFWKNILPNFDTWKEYKLNGKSTETALLRYVVNHLLECLDATDEKYFPEEMYIKPPIYEGMKTGGVVTKKSDGKNYIILSPACDLAVHNGQIKTDRILVCLIENLHDCYIVKNAKKQGESEILLKLVKNNNSNYYHYLPPTTQFSGGIINFRKIETYKQKEIKKLFDPVFLQISSAFVKDIVARFSSYYARQGQPDFNVDELMKKIMDN